MAGKEEVGRSRRGSTHFFRRESSGQWRQSNLGVDGMTEPLCQEPPEDEQTRNEEVYFDFFLRDLLAAELAMLELLLLLFLLLLLLGISESVVRHCRIFPKSPLSSTFSRASSDVV